MCGDVVGSLRRPAGVLPPVGIMLHLEQRLREGRVRLAHQDHRATRGNTLALQREALQRPPNFDIAPAQNSEERAQCDGVLAGWNDVRVRPFTPAARRAPLDGEEAREPALT